MNEISDRMISITLDGTSFYGEAVVFVVRFVDELGVIKKRLWEYDYFSDSQAPHALSDLVNLSLQLQYNKRSSWISKKDTLVHALLISLKSGSL